MRCWEGKGAKRGPRNDEHTQRVAGLTLARDRDRDREASPAGPQVVSPLPCGSRQTDTTSSTLYLSSLASQKASSMLRRKQGVIHTILKTIWLFVSSRKGSLNLYYLFLKLRHFPKRSK